MLLGECGTLARLFQLVTALFFRLVIPLPVLVNDSLSMVLQAADTSRGLVLFCYHILCDFPTLTSTG